MKDKVIYIDKQQRKFKSFEEKQYLLKLLLTLSAGKEEICI